MFKLKKQITIISKSKKIKKRFLLLLALILGVFGLLYLFLNNFNRYRNITFRNNTLRYSVIVPMNWTVSNWGKPINADPDFESIVHINPEGYTLYDASKIEILDFGDDSLEPGKDTLVEEIKISGVNFQKFTDYYDAETDSGPDFEKPPNYIEMNSQYIVWLLGKNKVNKRILFLYRYENEKEKKIIENIINTIYFY